MKHKQYRSFSLQAHIRRECVGQPLVCDFELTFRCGLHCRHCYTDCFNKAAFDTKELKTREVTRIIDAIADAGVLWLCFTGGDPLVRKDFSEIYSYARRKGFIITVFTTGYSMTDEMLALFKEQPPFVVEITLNAADQRLYEKISQVTGSFRVTEAGIRALVQAGIPLKIKAQVTQDNVRHLSKLKKFVSNLGVPFRPEYYLFPRLNKDIFPTTLRIPWQRLVAHSAGAKKPHTFCSQTFSGTRAVSLQGAPWRRNRLFACNICHTNEFSVDPSGNMILCPLIRKPAASLLKEDCRSAFKRLVGEARKKAFTRHTECSACNTRELCYNCPGNAYLETGDMEQAVDYYCAATRGGAG